MTKQVQRRRGTATQHTSFTGAEGEISVNTTNKSVHVHDGVTAGGVEAARADLSNVSEADVSAALAGATDVDINGGNIDGTVIGANSAAAITGTTITGTSFVTSGNMTFGDNDKAIFGAGSDLQIFHTGSYSAIRDVGTGGLFIGGENYVDIGNAGASATYARFHKDAQVDLYHNNTIKLATTSTGIDVTGEITADGLTVEAGIAQLELIDTGVSGSTKLRTANAQTWLEVDPDNVQASSGFSTYIDGKQFLKITDGGDISFYEDTGTTAKFFWDASAERLGIGTSSPQKTLHLLDTTSPYLLFHTQDNSMSADDVAGGILFLNSDDSTPSGDRIATSIKSVLEDGFGRMALTFSAGHTNVKTVYGDAPDYTDATIERMRIDSLGNVGIGTDSPHDSGYSYGDLSLSGASGGTLSFLDDGVRKGFIGSIDEEVRLSSTTATGHLTFRSGTGGAGTEAMRITSSGSVGIGTSSPDNKFHVVSGSSGEVAQFTGAVENRGLSIRSETNTNASAHVVFNSQSGGSKGMFTFETDSTERLRLSASGHLLVGTTDAGIYDDATDEAGHNLLSNGQYYNSAVSEINMILNKQNSDGDIVQFRKDGSTVGSIGSYGGELFLGSTGGTDAFIRMGYNTIAPANSSGTNRDATINLGASNNRFSNLYLSGGVYLGGTGSANTLDDYEEGTFIPTFSGATSGTVTLGNFNKLGYTKVGRKVTITGRVDVSGTPSLVGNLVFGNLPFATGNLDQQGGYSVQYLFITIGASVTGNPVIVELSEGVTTGTIRTEDWAVASGILVNNSRIQMSITYFAA